MEFVEQRTLLGLLGSGRARAHCPYNARVTTAVTSFALVGAVTLPALFLVVACGSDSGAADGARSGSDAVDASTSAADGSASDGGQSADGNGSGNGNGSGADGGAGTLDPATCAVGPADGCCPLAIELGGTDPDCASLACTTTTKGAPIPLHAPVSGWLGQIAMLWSGSELVLASTRERLSAAAPSTAYTDLVVQRRDKAGALISDTVQQIEDIPPGASSTAVRLDASGDRFFAWQSRIDQRYRIARVPVTGDPKWTTPLGLGCNDSGGMLKVFQDQGRLVVGMGQYTCGGSTFRPIVAALDASTGATSVSPAKVAMLDLTDDGAHSDSFGGAGFAFHPATRTLDVFYGRNYEGDARMRTLDFAAETKSAPVSVIAPNGGQIAYDPFVAYDGARYALALTGVPATSYVAQRFANGVMIPGAVTLASFSGSMKRTLPPSIVWTGDGYVVAVPYAIKGSGEIKLTDLRTLIVRLDANAALLESFELDSEASHLAQVIWAGGRIAISWVRPSGALGDVSQGFLRWLDCP